MHVWLLGLCVIMSMQLEDKDAKVSPKELALAKGKTDELKNLVLPLLL